MVANKDNEIPEGFKMTELGQLPEEWDAIKANDFCAFKRGTEPGSDTYNRGEQGLPFIRVGNIAAQMQELVYTTSTNVELSAKNDILMTFDGSPGVVTKGFEGAYSSGIRKVRPLSSNLDEGYLYFALQTDAVREAIDQYAVGVTIKHASKSLPHITIPLPPLLEQRAIAHVLSTIQRAIEAQDKLIAAARELKKSLTRHLFTYGPIPLSQAERVPLKETEIGLIPVHWEIARLGEICDIKGGKRLPKGHTFSGQPTSHPYIRVVDFTDNTVDMSDLKFLTEEDFQSIKRYTISSEDVYISIAGTIGLVGIVPRQLDGANLTENAAKLVIRDKNALLNTFLVSALSTDNGIEHIRQQTSKTSQPKLALARINQISIPVPPFSDQQQIAHILSAVDKKIEAEQNCKAALQSLFRTMLHLLMTGKVRVKDLEVPAS